MAIFLTVQVAPMGFCITSQTPKLDAGINKPVLRGSDRPSSLKLEGDISLSKGNPKISLSLRDSDVQQVLRMFADKAGLNIVFHSSVSGKVTLDLVNVPLNEAFKLVLQITDLTYYIDNNTMIVASASASKTLNLAKQELLTIPVKYVDATILADFLNKNIFSINKPGLSNSQIAVTNPIENEILIFGTKNDFLMAKKIINQFDIKPREEVFVVNHTTPKEMSDLICNVLLKDYGTKSTSTGSTGSSASTSSSGAAGPSAPGAGGNKPGGGQPDSASSPTLPSTGSMTPPSTVPGAPTGGAADSSGSGSGSSSSDSGSSSGSGGSTSSMSLGAGTIACKFNNPVSAGSVSSLNTTSLSVTYFGQRGTIAVMGGSAQQMQTIKEFIAKNDKKEPQAYMEISIIELNEDGSQHFNNTWRVWSENFCFNFDGTTKTNSLYPTFFKGDSWTDVSTTPAKDYVKFTGPATIAYTMDYLISNGKGRVLSNPRIMITNGQTSKIDLSADYVKTVTSQVLTNNGVQGTEQKTYEIGSDEGITVELVPFISPDGYVTLNIKPKYSTIKGEVKNKADDLVATLLQRRNLELKNIRIKDGETLVIGGMIREQESKTISKFPFLGDLPGVGMFFRNTSSTKEKSELVIMLTPKIIKDSEDLVNNTGTTL